MSIKSIIQTIPTWVHHCPVSLPLDGLRYNTNIGGFSESAHELPTENFLILYKDNIWTAMKAIEEEEVI